MKFSTSDIAAMLAAVGEDATLNIIAEDKSVSTGTLRVHFHAPGSVATIFGQMVVVEDPTAICSEVEAAALEITGGVSGVASELTIRGNDYRVISAVPDGYGFSVMTMEKIS